MILIPGDKLGDVTIKYITLVRGGKQTTLKSYYKAKVGDIIIARVIDKNPNAYLVDINGITLASISITNFKESLKVGDYVLSEVISVQGTTVILAGKKKLEGYIFTINPHKIPRVIGKNNSMLKMIKEKLNVEIIPAKNGRIFLKGDIKAVKRAINVIKIIEENSQRKSLTEYISKLIENEKI